MNIDRLGDFLIGAGIFLMVAGVVLWVVETL